VLELGRVPIFHSRKLQEVAEPQSIAVYLHTRHRAKQGDVLRLQQIRAPEENSSGSIEQSRFARSNCRGQQLVAQLLHVGRGMHVEDHQIAGDPFQPPVVVRPQQLPDARHSHRRLDRRQQDRPVAGDPQSPESILAELVLFDRALRRAKPRMRKHQMSSQILI
jgi:hypothetical protein